MTHISTAKQLLLERDQLDAKVNELLAVLEVNKSTMDSPLIDAEGFPLNEIDVYAVRHARHDLICLRNDREALTKKIATELEKVHSENRDSSAPHSENTVSASVHGSDAVVHRTSNDPFVKISEVTDHSPSHDAGIRIGDQIVQYGSLHAGNYTALKQIADITTASENKIIRVTVLRDARPVRLEIKPKKWSGPGLLGCKIVPINGTQM